MPSTRISKSESDHTYFVTITTIDWVEIFTSKEYCDVLIESLKFHQTNSNLNLMGYVIMSNHFHFIAEADDLSSVIQSIKSFTTYKLKTLLMNDHRSYILNHLKSKESFKIWQPTNMPKIIFTDKFYLQKLYYIHNNPVKKGLVAKPEDWVYSSARNYVDDDHSIIEIQLEEYGTDQR